MIRDWFRRSIARRARPIVTVNDVRPDIAVRYQP